MARLLPFDLPPLPSEAYDVPPELLLDRRRLPPSPYGQQVIVPPLPSEVAARVPEGMGLQPQSFEEESNLQRDAQAMGILGNISGIIPAHRGTQNMLRGIEEGNPWRTAGGIGQAGLSLAFPFAAGRAPFSTGLAAFASNLLGETGSPLAPAEAAEQPNEEVKKLQRMLQQEGYYTGPIDGVMKGGTAKAKAKFETDQARKAEAAAKKAESEAKGAETERLRLEGERTAAEREKQDKRVREIQESVPWWLRQAQHFGPFAGYAIGGVLGHRFQGKQLTGALEQRRLDMLRANDLAARVNPTTGLQISPANVNQRIANTNQFFTEGGGAAPFASSPTTRPFPWSNVNPAAVPEADTLYRISRGAKGGVGAGLVAGIGGTEAAISYFGFVAPIQRELEQAEAAIARPGGATEAAVQRVETLKNQLLFADLMFRGGQGAAVGAWGTEVMGQRRALRMRPNVGQADAERAQLSRILERWRQP